MDTDTNNTIVKRIRLLEAVAAVALGLAMACILVNLLGGAEYPKDSSLTTVPNLILRVERLEQAGAEVP